MTQIEFVRIMTATKGAQKAHQMPMTPTETLIGKVRDEESWLFSMEIKCLVVLQSNSFIFN